MESKNAQRLWRSSTPALFAAALSDQYAAIRCRAFAPGSGGPKARGSGRLLGAVADRVRRYPVPHFVRVAPRRDRQRGSVECP